MSVRRIAGTVALLVTCAASALAQGGQPLVVKATAQPCLTVRAEPTSSGDKLVCIPPGTRVSGIGTSPYWRRIRLADGRDGWAAAKYFEAAPGATGVGGPAPTDASIPEDAWLEIHFVDVGSGDGIWIHTYDDGIPGNGRFEGKNIVIDGGPTSDDATNPFYLYLKKNAYEGATIDALLLTHPHNDHYPGALSVLRHYEVCDYYDPGYPKEGPSYKNFLNAVRNVKCGDAATSVHLGRAQFGQPDWGSELRVEFLYAWPGSPEGLGSGNTLENNASIVMKLTYGTQSFLFMGDAEGKDRKGSAENPKYAEALMLADTAVKARLKSTLLKVAHHGSESSSTTPFINAVDPLIVVVSSGRKKFGPTFLPDKSTLQRYCDHNPAIRIYRTDQDDEAEHRTTANDKDGDHVVVRSNGRQTVVQAMSAGKPFTPTACSP